MIYPDLFEFAYVPNWYDQLLALADLALPESWRFREPLSPPKNADTPILEKYVNYVFKKQVIDFNNFQYESDPEYADKIFYLRNEKACFHTGLYTKNYKSIYGCFTRNKRKDTMLDWYFRGFFNDVAPDMKHVQPLPEKRSMPLRVLSGVGANFYAMMENTQNQPHSKQNDKLIIAQNALF